MDRFVSLIIDISATTENWKWVLKTWINYLQGLVIVSLKKNGLLVVFWIIKHWIRILKKRLMLSVCLQLNIPTKTLQSFKSIPPAVFLFHSIEFLKKLKDHVFCSQTRIISNKIKKKIFQLLSHFQREQRLNLKKKEINFFFGRIPGNFKKPPALALPKAYNTWMFPPQQSETVFVKLSYKTPS